MFRIHKYKTFSLMVDVNLDGAGNYYIRKGKKELFRFPFDNKDVPYTDAEKLANEKWVEIILANPAEKIAFSLDEIDDLAKSRKAKYLDGYRLVYSSSCGQIRNTYFDSLVNIGDKIIIQRQEDNKEFLGVVNEGFSILKERVSRW